jgi:hypothetical protein
MFRLGWYFKMVKKETVTPVLAFRIKNDEFCVLSSRIREQLQSLQAATYALAEIAVAEIIAGAHSSRRKDG